jgi:5'(3')-deoxyribonucleotidase
MGSQALTGDVRILLDMDEVLCDFVGAAVRLHGCSMAKVLPHWEAGSWSVRPALAAALKREDFGDEDFWAPITAAGASFWTSLVPHRWADELLTLVRNVTQDWHVVTAPSRCPTSYMGKMIWLEQYLGTDVHSFIPTRHKHLLANPRTILIDDSDSNVRVFRRAGGKAIVFPRHNNSMHRLKNDPLPYVRQALAACRGEVDDYDTKLEGSVWSGLDPSTRGRKE